MCSLARGLRVKHLLTSGLKRLLAIDRHEYEKKAWCSGLKEMGAVDSEAVDMDSHTGRRASSASL